MGLVGSSLSTSDGSGGGSDSSASDSSSDEAFLRFFGFLAGGAAFRFTPRALSLAGLDFFSAGLGFGFAAAFFGDGSSLQNCSCCSNQPRPAISLTQTHHCCDNDSLALLLPGQVGLEESLVEAKLPLCTRPDALDGQVIRVAALVEGDDDVAKLVRDCCVGGGHVGSVWLVDRRDRRAMA